MRKTNRRKVQSQRLPLLSAVINGKCPKCKETKDLTVLIDNIKGDRKLQFVLCKDCIRTCYSEV